jgi:uncharacterized protein
MLYTIITGSTKGIGYELANIYASKGHNLLLVARTQDLLDSQLQELVTKYNIDVKTLVLDLSNSDSASILIKYCQNNSIQVDNLINNAGFGDWSEFKDQQIDKITSMINLNITALTTLTYSFLDEIISNKGRIMLLASTAAFVALPKMAVYSATKAYVKSFGLAVNEEIAGSGASITVICPGPTESDFQVVAGLDKSKSLPNKLPTSKEVAEFAYKKTQERTPIAIHGLKNNILMQSLRFMSSQSAGQIAGKGFEN